MVEIKCNTKKVMTICWNKWLKQNHGKLQENLQNVVNADCVTNKGNGGTSFGSMQSVGK